MLLLFVPDAVLGLQVAPHLENLAVGGRVVASRVDPSLPRFVDWEDRGISLGDRWRSRTLVGLLDAGRWIVGWLMAMGTHSLPYSRHMYV